MFLLCHLPLYVKCWLLCRAVTVWCRVKGIESAGDNLWLQAENPLSAQWQGQRDGDRCTVEWVKTCGSQWRGVGPQIRGSFPLPAFSIKPQHTGNNLWTRPSNSPAPVLSPEPNLSHPPTTSNHSPKYPADPLTCSSYRKDKPFGRTYKTINVICMFLNASTCTHARSQAGHLCSHWGVSGYSSVQAQRWLIKKIQYSKCTGSPAYQYIIQKGDRWRAIRRWKAIEFSVSPYL